MSGMCALSHDKQRTICPNRMHNNIQLHWEFWWAREYVKADPQHNSKATLQPTNTSWNFLTSSFVFTTSHASHTTLYSNPSPSTHSLLFPAVHVPPYSMTLRHPTNHQDWRPPDLQLGQLCYDCLETEHACETELCDDIVRLYALIV